MLSFTAVILLLFFIIEAFLMIDVLIVCDAVIIVSICRIFFRGGQLFPFRESSKENIKIFFKYSDFMRAVFQGERQLPPLALLADAYDCFICWIYYFHR